ncbi:sugar phosphate isomerase epimerase, putative [Babesia ovis]|uniref:Sugar phosphate isomerase epimerase, putative n=1 Tax=Babesia ovis TaxID=5869 RepID=A0A9W5T9N4_BABOV|nr:sugar phosphate isomerase epimerase, putative [Babesia ovis]
MVVPAESWSYWVILFATVFYLLTGLQELGPTFGKYHVNGINIASKENRLSNLSYSKLNNNGTRVNSRTNVIHKFKGHHQQPSPAYAMPTVPVSISNLKCGEIVVGIPEKWNEDGSVTVDIGAESPLIVDGDSLMFFNNEERRRFEGILESLGQPTESPVKTLDELIEDTLIRAEHIPERKRKTLMRPKILYPQDAKKDRETSHVLSYDLGVGGELRPRQLDLPRVAGRRQPHCWFRDDQMEFILTDLDVYEGLIKGEVWSPSIVETKRQAYMAMALESVKPTASITAYKAVVKERDGDLLMLQFTDQHLKGLNVFSLANAKDKPGDSVMVYVAGSEPGLQHVYCTRNSISNDQLRDKALKMLYDEMLYHFVKTGKWLRAQYEASYGDAIRLRVAGKADHEGKYAAHIFTNQMPYFSPEGLLNEAFKQLNNPNDHFRYHDIMINVGKLNYGFNYDNNMFVRIHEYKVPIAWRSEHTSKAVKEIGSVELTTLNVCKPSGLMLDGFKRLTDQTVVEMQELKINTSYPAMVLGQDDGYLYLAINYKRKDEFTISDKYLVGMMKVVPKSKTLPPGSFVHARVLNISQNMVNLHYMESHSEEGGHDSFKYTAFTYWLNKVNEGKQKFGVGRFEEQKILNLIWMDGLCLPAPGSPQYDKFLAFQPLITEAKLVHTVDERLTPFSTREYVGPCMHTGGEPLAPEEITSAFLKAMKRKQRESVEPKQLPINMREFGSFTIQYDDGDESYAAPPCFYIHNRDIRLAMIEEQLGRHALWKFKKTLHMARMRTEGELKTFFTNSKGEPFYDLLQRLRDPIFRRTLKPKDALAYERNIKMLLSGIQDFYLESIYDATDKENLMFASLVPRSAKIGDFVQMEELWEFDHYLRNDFVMNKEARDSLRRVLVILSHPNNSLMSHMRHRHRTIDDEIFFAYRKMLHYDTWEDYMMPESELEEAQRELEVNQPMPPVSELVASPEGFGSTLLKHGMGQIKGLYSEFARLAKTPVSEYLERSLVHTNKNGIQRADDHVVPEHVDMYLDDLMEDEPEKQKGDVTDKEAPPRKVRMTPTEWRKLNKMDSGFNPEELKQYLRDLKSFQPVHGVRLPF